ncbi:hypothetical protein GCM10009632_11810 [Mycolicibacterium alvei]|uniref:Uncharacterized protein n=1 Tax=Mycolicibacterium alvei TaxID=67081 RepID=A0A6N4UU64_9MYCO|nr:hypothetical protein MALV_30740 [Mycolicibacterium alvei]
MKRQTRMWYWRTVSGRKAVTTVSAPTRGTDVENIRYPADWLTKGGPPFESMGLRQLPGPLTDYAALTLVRDHGVWIFVAGENNTMLGTTDELDDVVQYVGTYAWHVEHAERQGDA